MPDVFKGRVAVVTGAGSGIGRALALDLASRGALLAVCDIDADEVEATADMVRDRGAQAIADRLDVSDRAAFAKFADRVVGHFGAVNQLYNNAGIASQSAPFVEAEIALFDQVLSVNLDGVVNGTRAFLPHLIASGEGHLINISSLNGLMAQPHMASYVTSKFAVRGFTEAVRQEMIYHDRPVEVTLVHPGGVATRIASRTLEGIGALPPEKQAEAREQIRIYEQKFLALPAETAARQILDQMARGRRRIVLTGRAKFLDVMVRLLPESYVGLVAKKARKMVE